MNKKTIKENAENTSKTDKFESLSKVIDAVINKDDATAESSFSSYVTMKAREMLGIGQVAVTEHAQRKEEDEDSDDEDDAEGGGKYSHLLKQRAKKKAPLKKMKKDKELSEAALLEFTGKGSPITLKGDDVFVNGKQVGSVVNDLSDINAGIRFESLDGKVSEEFDDIRGLYQFLIGHFNVNSETPLDADEE